MPSQKTGNGGPDPTRPKTPVVYAENVLAKNERRRPRTKEDKTPVVYAENVLAERAASDAWTRSTPGPRCRET